MANKTYTEADMDNAYDKGFKDGVEKIIKKIKAELERLDDMCWEADYPLGETGIKVVEELEKAITKQQQNGH